MWRLSNHRAMWQVSMTRPRFSKIGRPGEFAGSTDAVKSFLLGSECVTSTLGSGARASWTRSGRWNSGRFSPSRPTKPSSVNVSAPLHQGQPTRRPIDLCPAFHAELLPIAESPGSGDIGAGGRSRWSSVRSVDGATPPSREREVSPILTPRADPRLRRS